MLTNDDINYINSNRAEVTQNRTESVILVKPVISGTDPFTGETIEGVPERIAADVVWKEYSTVSNGDRAVIGGVELLQDDVKVTFDISVDLTNVDTVERKGVPFTLIAIDEKGIGTPNRYECVARRVT